MENPYLCNECATVRGLIHKEGVAELPEMFYDPFPLQTPKAHTHTQKSAVPRASLYIVSGLYPVLSMPTGTTPPKRLVMAPVGMLATCMLSGLSFGIFMVLEGSACWCIPFWQSVISLALGIPWVRIE